MRWLGVILLVAAVVVVTPAPPARAGLPERVARADAYLATRPGTVGYVVRDRATGLAYRNAAAGTPIWTASTIKLAIAVDLLSRERAGQLRLSQDDRQLMSTMLRASDNDATDTLWDRYGGPDYTAFNRDFPAYGMTGVRPQPGFGDVFPYWGFQKSTTDDLDRLMNFTLTRMVPADTAAIVAELQRVEGNQQWGVWGAGPAMAPGNKNGWSQEQGGWVVNSVGFAGPRQRYTLAIMNALGDQGGYDDGVQTATTLARILLSPQ